jgi:BON domain
VSAIRTVTNPATKAIGALGRRTQSTVRSAFPSSKRPSPAAIAGPAAGAGAAIAFFLDPAQGRRRRKLALQRTGGFVRGGARRGGRAARYVASETAGAVRRVSNPRSRQDEPADDGALARKVETERFRPADVPKGSINVHAVDSVVELRGAAERREQVDELEARARKVAGVRDVRNLIHVSGS